MRMSNIVYKVWLMMLLFVPGMAGAQGYNPDNPPDPMMRFRVTVSANTDGVAYVSGGGLYAVGATVRVSTSRRDINYEFLYWTKDGVQINEAQSFDYTMTNEKVSFVAVYGYNPPNPGEPTMSSNYRLFVETDAEGSCTFSITSGLKMSSGQDIWVAAQDITPGYVFLGWYKGEEQVSTTTSFWYVMPDNDVTLTAKFVYDPDNPDDPEGVNEPETLMGDVNGDGVVNEVDAQLILDVSVGLKSLDDLAVPAAISVPGGNDNALEVNAQIVLDYSVTAVKPW